MNTKIISAFPACGKTHFYENNKDKISLDSDSSEFSWIKDENGNNTKERNPEFPSNYMNHIKENLGKVDIIFVSSHKVVRDALKENELNYVLVYPKRDLKEVWLERFRNRGNDDGFINFISNNWDNFLDEIDEEIFPCKFEISDYMSDLLEDEKTEKVNEYKLFQSDNDFE